MGEVIHVTRARVVKEPSRYTCKISKGKRAEAERARAVQKKGCPASQSVRRGINVEYSAEFEEI